MRHFVVGTAGHIDHGKSALVMALTGVDPDRLKEEKARGITIDLGFAHLDLGDLRVSFVDVPGHERFVKNMLAGVTGIDAVLLVVAADESVMPQTREHFDICRLLGVRSGVIVLTKADLVDQETVELVRLEVRELARGSFLDGAPVLPVSSVTGQGMDALRAELVRIGRTAATPVGGGVTRLPVDRVFPVKGFGTVVTGTLVSGHVRVDDELVLAPAGRRVKVRGLQAHGRGLTDASPGQRLAVNLAGVDHTDVERGETLVADGAFAPTRILDAAIELLPSARPLRHGSRVRFHAGTSEILGRVALSAVLSSEGGDADARPAEVPPGATAHVRLRLEAPAVVTRGDRFILRAYSPPITIAGGSVLDPSPARGPIRTPRGRARFLRIADLTSAGETPFLEQLLAEVGPVGIGTSVFVTRAGIDPSRVAALTNDLVSSGRACRVGPLVVPTSAMDDLADRLMAAVHAYHAQQPLSEGLPREEARSRVFARADPAVFDAVLDRLTAAGQLTGRERLAVPGHRAGTEEDRQALDRVAAVYERAGLVPPEVADVPAAAGLPLPLVERALTLLSRQRTLVKVGPLLFHLAALDGLKAEVRALKGTADGARLDVGFVKTRYGISRKYAIPLLEYLDRERVTRRVGESRIVL